MMIYKFEWPKINSCEDCPLLDAEQKCFCMLNNRPVRKNPGIDIGVPEWCELKESEEE